MRLSLEAKHVKPNSIKLERFYHYIFFSQEKSGTAYCWIACSHNNGKHFIFTFSCVPQFDSFLFLLFCFRVYILENLSTWSGKQLKLDWIAIQVV